MLTVVLVLGVQRGAQAWTSSRLRTTRDVFDPRLTHHRETYDMLKGLQVITLVLGVVGIGLAACLGVVFDFPR